MAEEVRFELTEGVNPRRFSRPVPSTTRPFLRGLNGVQYNIVMQQCKLKNRIIMFERCYFAHFVSELDKILQNC